ncbi:MAG: FecR domain-containing protein [Magnetococcales bacterium]|nr:FecR domain-containing protein [Magnetococcales bacterium]
MIRSLDPFIPGQHRPWTPEVMDVAAGKPLVVGHDDFLLSAQFTRQGSDLLLEGGVDYPGHSVLIPGYFSMAAPPDLVTDYDARITADLAHRLAGPMVPAVYAENAAPTAATTAISGGDGVGRVETVDKGATIVRAGIKMAAVKGMAIQQGDVIETVKGGGVGLVYADNTTISLANSGRMVVEEMKFDPAKGEGRSTTNVVQGEFSFVSGQVAKMGTDRMVFKTPVAVIGVRGTTVAGKASAEGSENSFTLLPDADGGVGKIAVTNQTGTIILSQPNQTTTLTSFTIKPTAPVILSPQEVQSRYGGATRILPPPPVTNQDGKTGADAAGKSGDGQPGGEGKVGENGEKAPDGENQPKGEGDAPPPKGGPGEGGETPPVPGEEGKPPLGPGQGATPPEAGTQGPGGPPQGGVVMGGQPGAMAGPQPPPVAGPQPISLASAQQGAMGGVAGFSNIQSMGAKPLGSDTMAPLGVKGVADNPMAPAVPSLGATNQANRSVLTNANDGPVKTAGTTLLQPTNQTLTAGTLPNVLKSNTVVGPTLEVAPVVPQTQTPVQGNNTPPVQSQPTAPASTQPTAPASTTPTPPDVPTTPSPSVPSPTVPVVAPTLAVQDTFGSHVHPFYLSIDAALVDTDGTETLTIAVDGLPAGSTLSAGEPNASGHWIVPPEQLHGLSLTLPQGAPDTFSLTVTATTTDATGSVTEQAVDTLGVWQAGANDLFYVNYSYAPGLYNESALWENFRLGSGSVTVDAANHTFTYQETMASDNTLAPSPFGSYTQYSDGMFNLVLTNNVIAHGAISENNALGMFFFAQESYETATPSSTMGLVIPDGIGLNNASLMGEYRFAYLEDHPSGPVTGYGKVTLDGAGKGTAVDQATSDGHPTTTHFDYSVQANGELVITESDGTVGHGKISPDGEVFFLTDFNTSSTSIAIGLHNGTAIPTVASLNGDYTFGKYNTYLYNSPSTTTTYNNWYSKAGIMDFNDHGVGQEYQIVSDSYLITGNSTSATVDADGWFHMSNATHSMHDSIGILSSDGSILVTVDAQLNTVDHSDSVLGLGIAIRQDTVDGMLQGGSASSGTLVTDILGRQGDDGFSGTSGIAVTDAPNVAGVGHWQYTLDSGATWSDFGSVSSNSAQVLAANSATQVRFVPDASYTGDSVLQYHPWDGSGGYHNGQVGVDVMAHSGASGFGKVPESAVISVMPTPHDTVQYGMVGMNSTVFGTSGHDLLLGQSGNDSLRGNAGNDTLVGGGGNDTFYYYSASDSTVAAPDTIVDFNNGGNEKINFAPSMITGTFGYIGSTAFHATGHTEARFDATSAVLHVDLGGDGVADMAIKMSHVTLADLDSTDFTTTSVIV